MNVTELLIELEHLEANGHGDALVYAFDVYQESGHYVTDVALADDGDVELR